LTLVAALAIIVITAHPVHPTGSSRVADSLPPDDTVTASGSVHAEPGSEWGQSGGRVDPDPGLTATASPPTRLAATIFPVDIAPLSRVRQPAGLSTFARALATAAVRLLRVPVTAEVREPDAEPLASAVRLSVPAGAEELLAGASSATYIEEIVLARRSFLTRWNTE